MRYILAAASVLALTTAALADPFAAVYGNTVTQTLPDGNKMTIYINADKTWEQHVGNATYKGIYAWKDDSHACFTVTDPAPANPATATTCHEIKDTHNVGDTWTQTLPDGRQMTLSITAGR